jgi:hypothetical protein
MNAQESEHLWRLVRQLQRQPEAVDDVQAQRALTVLMASRRDAPMLMLQRLLALEIARAAPVQPGPAATAAAEPPAAAAAAPVPLPEPQRPSPFLRQAGAVAVGVVGGGLVLGALDALGEALGGEDGLF